MSATPTGRTFRPRNPAATKELLLTAAAEEFAEHGFAGARIDRIADGAQTNKRMIYAYFGDKDGLFDAVLELQIKALAEAVPLRDGDLVTFAAARFDYMLANPAIRRIATWRTFEGRAPSRGEEESYKLKVAAVAQAQREGRISDAIRAVDLFAIVLRMSESWLSAPAALQAVPTHAPMSDERLSEHRASLVRAVELLTSASPPDGDG